MRPIQVPHTHTYTKCTTPYHIVNHWIILLAEKRFSFSVTILRFVCAKIMPFSLSRFLSMNSRPKVINRSPESTQFGCGGISSSRIKKYMFTLTFIPSNQQFIDLFNEFYVTCGIARTYDVHANAMINHHHQHTHTRSHTHNHIF